LSRKPGSEEKGKTAEGELDYFGAADTAASRNDRMLNFSSMAFSWRSGFLLTFFAFLNPTLGEGVTRHDFCDESLHMIAVLGDDFHQAIHYDLIITLQLAAERIGEELLGKVASEFRLFAGDNPFELTRGRKAFATRQLSRGVDRASGIILFTPAANRIEVLEAKSNRIQNLVTICARRIRAVLLGLLA
jgi:hypothetical protein